MSRLKADRLSHLAYGPLPKLPTLEEVQRRRKAEQTKERRFGEMLLRLQAQAPYRMPKNSVVRVFVSDKDLRIIRSRFNITTYERFSASVELVLSKVKP
jgi:hypothetical protein